MQVINLRTLKPIDRDTIVKSIKKTHRVVSAEEGWPQCGIGAELIAIATEECFDDLDAPPERVTGAEVPMPYAANLEAAALPQVTALSLPLMHHWGESGRVVPVWHGWTVRHGGLCMKDLHLQCVSSTGRSSAG